ncbi:MAG: alkaline phosphatase [Pseudomonadota bacterium]
MTRRRVSTGLALAVALSAPALSQEVGNVVFFHPDGTGVNHWTAARMHTVGPDGQLNWDRLPGIGVYTGHMRDRLTATSHGGATTHAYGIKTVADSFGLDGKETITAASGRQMSIAEEAMDAGKAVALVQTGHIAEPGTAAFVASVKSRSNRNEIAKQVIESGAQVIMAGGERYLLPEGAGGRHGSGSRTDGLNLIERAEELGYTIIYTRDELMTLDTSGIDKLLGIFAHNHTFNDQEFERNAIAGLPTYAKGAATIAEMTSVALEIVSRDEDGFFAVIEEEGTDNIPNNMNAAGTLEALARADEATGVILDFIDQSPGTMLLMAADSDAGGMQVYTDTRAFSKDGFVGAATVGGSVLRGQQGAFGELFLAEPNAAGERLPFAIAFTGYSDVAGGILVRAAGLNHDMVEPLMDNSDLYKLIYATLFGQAPGAASR